MNGKFIVFEGGEGCGKTTQAKMLAEWLEKNDREVILTKEPGGDAGICKNIREILLNSEYKDKFSHRAELLLFEADRAQHVESVIQPALAQGKIVISDRFEAATFAYQCGGRKVCHQDEFQFINKFATDGLVPDFTFWLDIDPAVGLKRNVDAKKRDRFEMENLDFHQRVRAGYAEYLENLVPKANWVKLDGSQPIAAIHNQVISVVKNRPD